MARLSSSRRRVYLSIQRLTRDDVPFLYSCRGMRIPSLPARASFLSLTFLFYVWLGTGEARAQLRCEGPLWPVAKAVAPARPDCGVSFWATWCGPCQEELPRLSQLSHEYVGKPVQFVAASIDDPKDRPKIQPFLAKNNIALNVWIGPDSAFCRILAWETSCRARWSSMSTER